jgi:hypothetical protein
MDTARGLQPELRADRRLLVVRRFVLLLSVGAFISIPTLAVCQQAEADRALIRSLTTEVIGLTVSSTNDTASRAILGEAANLQLEFEDFDGFLSSARLIRQMPNSKGQYRQMSRSLVCYMLEERKIDEAKRFAFALADGSSDEDDWIRAHLAMHLLYLPRPLRDSLKTAPIDSVALQRDAFTIARSITTPEVTTDTHIAFAVFLIRANDSVNARNELRAADSARRLIANKDRATSRATIIARNAATLGDWPLANSMVEQLSTWLEFQYLAEGSTHSSPGTNERPELASFNRRILDRYIELLKHNPDERVRDHLFSQLRLMFRYKERKALADSLLPAAKQTRQEALERPPEQQYDSLMMRGIESIQKRNIAEAERLLRALPDPKHEGLGARVMINMATNAHPDDSQMLRKRGLAMLLGDPKLKPRDQILSEVARERLAFFGDNEMAIDLVNEMRDVKLARETLADIGQSTMANLDASKLRKLVDRIRSSEVKEQVLFRLMISMLLARGATPSQNAWGLAIADSIQTPDLHARARIESAKFRWAHGDSTRARVLLLEALRDGVEKQNQYDRHTIISLLIAANATDELLAWARSERDPTRRARKLLAVMYPLRARLPQPSNSRGVTFSNGPDGCRRDF